MKTIGLVGTGTMATGIAQAFVQHGYPLVLVGRSEASTDRCIAGVRKALFRLVSKQQLHEDEAEKMLAAINGGTDYERLADCQLIVESVAEDLAIKTDVLSNINANADEDAIIATNTSSLSLEALASLVNNPEQFIGMHFFHPVPLMSLVEVVSGLRTSDLTRVTIRELALKLGKQPVEVKDAPGFVVNRVLFPMINEAAFALQEGVSDAEGIDNCMRAGCNHPLGPLALADLVGLDVVYAILKSLQEEYGNPRYAPCLEIKKRVQAGLLGRKSGRGFYDYAK